MQHHTRFTNTWAQKNVRRPTRNCEQKETRRLGEKKRWGLIWVICSPAGFSCMGFSHFSKVTLSQKPVRLNIRSSGEKAFWWFLLFKQKRETNFFPSLTASPDPSAGNHDRMNFSLKSGVHQKQQIIKGLLFWFSRMSGKILLLLWLWKVLSFGF